MPTERRPRSNDPDRPAARRQAYDQTRDVRRTAPAGPRRAARQSGPGQTVSFEAARRAQNARPRPDNSIEFPVQQTRRPAGSGSQRPANSRAPQRSARPDRAPQQPRSGQRLRPAQNAARDPARREKRKHRRLTRAEARRRRVARRLTAFVMLLCVIAAGVYLTVTMLFKINSIQVQTADGAVVQEAGGYASADILQALGVQLEENIFSFDASERAAALEKQFPLLEQIAVERRYPNGVVVRVTEAVPAYGMQTAGGWLTLSTTLKILSCGAEQPALPTLHGGEPVSTAPGEQLDFAAPQAEQADPEAELPQDPRLEALNTLIGGLSSHGLLADVTRIEFADTEQMAFLYQDRISVLLGTLNELDYKLDFAAYLLHNTDGKGCSETDTGALDCSHVRQDGTLRPILAQGDPALPSGYVVPLPIEEAAGGEAPADPAAEQPPQAVQ
ncbi:MAG: FtsQ-type POTRA domain-containing protein [Faecalibacterium sp.]